MEAAMTIPLQSFRYSAEGHEGGDMRLQFVFGVVAWGALMAGPVGEVRAEGCSPSCGAGAICLATGTCSTDPCSFTDEYGCCGQDLLMTVTCSQAAGQMKQCGTDEVCGWSLTANGGQGGYSCLPGPKQDEDPTGVHRRVCGDVCKPHP